jgi:hypothetical protein
MEKQWKHLIGKRVRLLIEDFNSFPKPRDGKFITIDETHIHLQTERRDSVTGLIKIEIVPFLRSTVRRVEIKE